MRQEMVIMSVLKLPTTSNNQMMRGDKFTQITRMDLSRQQLSLW